MQSMGGSGQLAVRGATWLSLGLGIAQVVAPGRLASLIGVRDTGDTRSLMRLIGARETASGIGLLSGTKTDAWLGARLGGDLVDLALLAAALRGRRVNRTRLFATTAVVLGATALDLFGASKAAGAAKRPHSPTSRGRNMPTTKTTVINREPEDVYQFWLNFANFPRFMKHVESVTVLGGGRSHWKARGPAGKLFEWDAEIVENRPNELISWRSTPGADVDNAGSVRFERAPGGRGTLVRVNLRYDPPAGMVGATIATLLGREPGQEVTDDLRRFKQVLETGEVVRSDASIHPRMHNARPPDRPIPLQEPYPTAAPTRTRSQTWSEAREHLEASAQSGTPTRSADRTRDTGATPTRGGSR